jgi:hypothetical protein
VTSASDAKNYYAPSVSPGGQPDRQGYYAEGQEAAGIYGGNLAEHLGLAGKAVEKAAFERLCDNLHPTKDKPLTPRTNDFRRVCKDVTFSGPKSFSIVEAFAGAEERKRLRRAFDDAIAETVAQDIEPDMQCRERAKGADRDITTGNVLTVEEELRIRPSHGFIVCGDGTRHWIENTDGLRAWVLELAGQIQAAIANVTQPSRSIRTPGSAAHAARGVIADRRWCDAHEINRRRKKATYGHRMATLC